MKEPNTQKGLMRGSTSKMTETRSPLSTSPYRDSGKEFKATHNNSFIKDPNYYTTRVDDDERTASPEPTYGAHSNMREQFIPTGTLKGTKVREDLCRSLVEQSSFDSVLMPPVALMDRKYNNLTKLGYKKAQKELKFPMNPAFISDPKFNNLPPLQDLITY